MISTPAMPHNMLFFILIKLFLFITPEMHLLSRQIIRQDFGQTSSVVMLQPAKVTYILVALMVHPLV